MGVDLFDIIVSWFQNISLILRQKVELPAIFSYIQQFYDFILNFDLNKIPFIEYLKAFSKYTELDFRVQYLIINVLIPLSITLVTLILFQQIYVIIWYLLLLIGILCIVVGLFAFLLPQRAYSLFMQKIWIGTVNLPIEPELLLIAFGGIIFCVCLIIGFISCSYSFIQKRLEIRRHRKIVDIQMVRRKIKKKGTSAAMEDMKKKKKTKPPKKRLQEAELRAERDDILEFSLPRAVVNFICVTFMLGAGLFMLQIVKLEYFGWENNIVDQTFSDPGILLFSRVFGAFTIIAGFVTLVQTMLSCCECGRKFEYNAVKCCKINMLKIVMLILTTIYTPVVTSLVSSFMCSYNNCGVGTQFPVNFNTLSLDTFLEDDDLVNQTTLCKPCAFMGNCTLIDELCPAVRQLQLDTQITVNCLAEMAFFFWPPSVILIVTFVIGVPVFFFLLTCRSAKELGRMEVDFMLDRYMPLWIRDPKKAKKFMEKYPDKKTMDELKFKPKYDSDYEFNPPNTPPELIKRRKTEMKNKEMMKKHAKKMNQQRWLIRTSLTKTPCRSLYFAFESKWRYFKMIVLVAKVILVAFSIFLIDHPYVSLPMQLLVHTLFATAILFTFPYNDWWLDIVQLIASVILVFDAAYVFANFFYTLPEWTFYPVVIINVICVPVLAICILVWSFFSKTRYTRKYKNLIRKLQLLQRQGIVNIQKKFNFARIRSNFENTDEMVNTDNMRLVMIFFGILGLSTFVALVGVSLGLLYGEFNPPYVPNVYEVQRYTPKVASCEAYSEKEFAGYDNWIDFTENCCCFRSNHHDNSATSNHYLEVEMWQCRNNLRKERVRSIELSDGNADHVLNGTVVRPFCEKRFNPGYYLITPCFHNKTENPGYTILMGNPDSLESDSMDDDKFNIRKYYW